MAQKTSGQFEKEFMESLEGRSGKKLSWWLKALDGFPSRTRNEVIARLKADHGFGHMEASLLAGIHANGGKPVYASTSELLDAQFARSAEMRPLYEAFVKFILERFPSATILPKKTYVSVLENREFAAVNMKAKELRIGLDLGDEAFDEFVEKARLTGPMPRISHMTVLTRVDQLDDRLAEALSRSRNRCH